MESEETHIDENLKEAYNYGYLIGKRRPKIAESLQASYSKKHDMETPGIITMLVEGIEQGVKEIESKRQIKEGFEEIGKARKEKEARDLSPDIE